MSMIRTQIYLPEDLHRNLTLLARTSKTNISRLLREGAGEVIKKMHSSKRNTSWGKGFIGALKSKVKTNAVEDIHEYYRTGIVK